MQATDFHLALPRRLLAVEITDDTRQQGEDQDSDDGQAAFHAGSLLLFSVPPWKSSRDLAQVMGLAQEAVLE
ncbi:hypothetical protein PproGo58_55970 [Pseudomonas protegens]|nr:hypothetical protein PproGo58_55970 [Pseudomonas protegens]